jgi:thiamine kinase-like enzyme
MIHHDILSQQYNMPNAKLIEVTPGWSALAYRVEVNSKRFFLKAYDKTRHSAQFWIEGIDRYIPALIRLGEHTALQGRIPNVVTTNSGSYKCEDENHLYILFDWIDGTTPCDNPLKPPQLSELAQIIAELHGFGEDNSTLKNVLRENYDIHFYDSLMSRVKNRDENIPRKYHSLILEKLHHLSEVSSVLTEQKLPFVLCHNDIHGWNVITQGDRLVLLDWEGLKFVPAEADLFMFKYERYWGERWDEFYNVYKKAHPNLELNETAMRFFQLRRRLWDIDEFVDNITLDKESAPVQEEASRLLIRECGLL